MAETVSSLFERSLNECRDQLIAEHKKIMPQCESQTLYHIIMRCPKSSDVLKETKEINE